MRVGCVHCVRLLSNVPLSSSFVTDYSNKLKVDKFGEELEKKTEKKLSNIFQELCLTCTITVSVFLIYITIVLISVKVYKLNKYLYNKYIFRTLNKKCFCSTLPYGFLACTIYGSARSRDIYDHDSCNMLRVPLLSFTCTLQRQFNLYCSSGLT